MDKSIKTWRVFLFGMCRILVSLYIKKILLSLEIIKGDFFDRHNFEEDGRKRYTKYL